MTKIEVVPTDDNLNWGVYVEGNLVGTAKNSFDADFAAHQMAKLYEEAEVLNYPGQRSILQEEVDAARKRLKSATRK